MIDFLLARQFPLEGEREEKVLLILNDGDLWMATRIGNAVASAPQSLLEPRTAPQPAEPIAEPKRKRGRPRKQPLTQSWDNYSEEEKARFDKHFSEDTASHEQAPKTFRCSYCGRILPVAVRELHEPNCRSAAVGYATHVAQPGKGGSELG